MYKMFVVAVVYAFIAACVVALLLQAKSYSGANVSAARRAR